MSTTPRIGVIGIPGKWSTETLADAVERETGFRLLVDMADVHLDLQQNTLYAGTTNLCELDALIVKKISAVYSPNTLDRLELLRVAEQAGVRVFSPAQSMLRLIDRLSCTVTLRNADIPMPDTWVTGDVDSAIEAVQRYSSAVFKPLYSTKARGMCIIDADQPDTELEQAIRDFKKENPMMYIQRKIELPGQDLGLVFLAGRYLGSYARVSQNIPGIQPFIVVVATSLTLRQRRWLSWLDGHRHCSGWISPPLILPKRITARLSLKSPPLVDFRGPKRALESMPLHSMLSMY